MQEVTEDKDALPETTLNSPFDKVVLFVNKYL
jgi:hypothetical protein